jgi:ABC-type sugar transport system permease subunit
MLLPVSSSIILSFFNYKFYAGTLNATFVGINNYITLVSDPIFFIAIRNTLFLIILLPFFILFSIFLAILVEQVRFGKRFFMTIILLPYVIPLTVHAIIFSFIYQPNYGYLNYFFYLIGFRNILNYAWLNERGTALLSVEVVWMYAYLGYATILSYAGLKQIPRQYYEAAEVDGAGFFTRIRHITLPLLSNAMLYLYVSSTIFLFNILPLIWVMTGGGFGYGAGGPAFSTYTLDLYVYHTAFRDSNYGYASTLATCIFIIIFIITSFYFKEFKEVRY